MKYLFMISLLAASAWAKDSARLDCNYFVHDKGMQVAKESFGQRLDLVQNEDGVSYEGEINFTPKFSPDLNVEVAVSDGLINQVVMKNNKTGVKVVSGFPQQSVFIGLSDCNNSDREHLVVCSIAIK